MAKKDKKKDVAKPAAESETPAETAVDVSEATEATEEIAELGRQLEDVRAEAAEAADRALRTLAEFDNYRKRVERERRGASAAGASEVLLELLAVADNFDRALEHAGDDVPESFIEGMSLVARSLHELLERRGVTRIESTGRPFDPEVHEALSSLPSEDAEPNTVTQEIQPGYRLGERVLRPAKVIVARAKAEE